MKKFLVIIFISCIYYNGFSQDEKNEKASNKLLAELADNACKCVDSIDTYNKSKEEITNGISDCINKQTRTYQVFKKLLNIDESKKDAEEIDGKKQINITINMDENSEDFKEYYFEIEKYMMNNCAVLRQTIATSDNEGEKSLSNNPEAIKWYSKGLEVTKKEKFKKAIVYYEKAVALDSNFAFAWDNMGICSRRIGDYDKALYAYKKSLEIDPMGMMPLQNIAVVYTYKKQYDNAIKSYERLSVIDKNNPEIYYGIGQIYYEYLKEYEKSLDNMCKAYNLYVKLKSPYRTDAEQIIQYIYTEMKKNGMEDRFNEILKNNNITPK